MEFIYSALQFFADIGGLISDFFSAIPDIIKEIFTYAWYWSIKIWLYFKITGIELAYSVAEMFLSEYEVYAVLNAAFNALPSDLRGASYALGIVDAVRIIVDAMATALVLRIMGW